MFTSQFRPSYPGWQIHLNTEVTEYTAYSSGAIVHRLANMGSYTIHQQREF
jgi:hypothetical protein